MSDLNHDEIRGAVRAQYGEIARTTADGCCPTPAAGPGPDISSKLGYSAAELAVVPDGANMGLGCGNPTALAALREGETVLDLGSGGGFDCFLAARSVGPTGSVIGVDMTPDMITQSRKNAATMELDHVDFRLGEIERLPVADQSVDVIMSNCVINLSPDKAAVFHEAARVLRPGGRIAISDVVATGELPEELQSDVLALTGCVAGAVSADEVHTLLEDAGFTDIHVNINEASRDVIAEWMPGSGVEKYVVSATIEATLPTPAVASNDCCAATCCAPSDAAVNA